MNLSSLSNVKQTLSQPYLLPIMRYSQFKQFKRIFIGIKLY